MNEPRLIALGVYRPVIDPGAWQKQREVTASDEETKEYFDHLVLIEAIVENLDGPFIMGEFGQMQVEFPDDPSRMLVGYDEGLLSSDGETLIQREMDCVQGTGPLRFATYLQFYDPERPIQWQCGSVRCPVVHDAPLRLMMLMPYNACS
jgi:hypothetical protein